MKYEVTMEKTVEVKADSVEEAELKAFETIEEEGLDFDVEEKEDF